MIDPYVVTRPAVSRRSLTATCTPAVGCSGRASHTVTAAMLLAALARELDLLLRLGGGDADDARHGGPRRRAVGRDRRQREHVRRRRGAAERLQRPAGQLEADVVVAAADGDRAEHRRAQLRLHGSLAARLDDQAELRLGRRQPEDLWT